jgi:hypothetical protein
LLYSPCVCKLLQKSVTLLKIISMKRILFAVFVLCAFALNAQWVRPNQFTELTTVTDSTFEVYSQRFGLPRKASLTTIKKFMDQSLSISGDSVCITRATGTVCVKLPAQAFVQSSQSWARSLVGDSYSIPADTLTKYDYLFVQYETNITPAGSTISFPTPSAATNGKIIDVLVYIGPSASIQYATLSGKFSVISGLPYSFQNFYNATPGHYRFVSTASIASGGYNWQLISSPDSPTAAATSSKRVKSQVINSQSVVFTDTTFRDTDEFTVYAEAESGNTQLKVPIPDSSFAGKVLYYYPQKTSTYTNTITCDAVRLLTISETTAFATTTTSSSIITVPKKLTGVLYEGTYYWEVRNLYNDAGVEKTTFSTIINVISTSDTIEIDTFTKYDEVHVQLIAQNNRTIYLPSTIPAKGKVLWFYPIRVNATPTTPVLNVAILGGFNYITYYNSSGTQTTASIDATVPIKLVSDGTKWYWFTSPVEQISQNKLIGRFSSGVGQAQEVSISSDFTMANGTLALASAGSGYSFYTTTFAGGGRIFVAYQGAAPTASGSSGSYTLTIPSTCRPISFQFNGTSADLTGGGSLNITCSWTSPPSSLNTSENTAFVPAITVVETSTAARVQLNNTGAGFQITHPTISANATTTTITGINGLSEFFVKGVF